MNWKKDPLSLLDILREVKEHEPGDLFISILIRQFETWVVEDRDLTTFKSEAFQVTCEFVDCYLDRAVELGVLTAWERARN